MSSSENNMNRQVKRHRGPLIGFVVIVVFVAVLIVWWLGREIDEAVGPAETVSPTESIGSPADGPAAQPGVGQPSPGIGSTGAQDPADPSTAPAVGPVEGQD